MKHRGLWREAATEQHGWVGTRMSTRAWARKPRKDTSSQDQDKGAAPSRPADMPILEIPSTSAPSRPLERSSYRRESLTGEELKQAKAAARKELQAREAAVQRTAAALKSGQMDLMYKSLQPSVMLVDGYNILHKSEHLVHLFSRNMEYGRAELEKWLSIYCRAARIQCLVVYDAMMSRMSESRVDRVTPWLSVIYSRQSEADTYIVARAQQFRDRGAYKVVVVTADRRVHDELADDEQSIVMLDADTFARHLRECNTGNTSGPEQWRSVWAVPRWSAAQAPSSAGWVPAYKPGGPVSGHTSEDEEASESGRNVQEVMDSDELQAQLDQLLVSVRQEQLKKRSKELANAPTANMFVLSSLAGGLSAGALGSQQSESSGGSDDDDDDDDDLDLDALLKKKL